MIEIREQGRRKWTRALPETFPTYEAAVAATHRVNAHGGRMVRIREIKGTVS